MTTSSPPRRVHPDTDRSPTARPGSAPGSGSADPRSRRAGLWEAGLWLVLVVGVTVYLADRSNPLANRLLVGNVAFALALTLGALRCFRAARPRSSERWGWVWMGIGLSAGALGQVAYTLAGLGGASSNPSPLVAVLTFLSYAPPMIIAPFCFKTPRERLISRFRRGVDVAVISVGVLIVSEATVLSVVRGSLDMSRAHNLVALIEPVADTAICSIVLTLGMRQPPERRLRFLCMGAGLLSLGVTDSISVRLGALGVTDLTGTPLMAGWIATPALIALATRISTTGRRRRWDLDLAARLVPYVPVVSAAVVLVVHSVWQDPFLLVGGIVLLVTVSVRQVMIVYENLTLTRDLEARVVARTAELATLGSIVTSSSDAIVGVSLDRVVLAWNPAAERLFGYRAAEAVGATTAFLPPPTAERIHQLLIAAERGDALASYEVEWERPDGTVVPVSMTVSPILDEGLVTGVSVSGADITERRQAAAVLERAREDALQSTRAKSDFLATMSHEIRTPMNGVIGLISLLMDTHLDAQQRGYAEGVHSAGQALLDVINDILDFSKLEAGKVVLDHDDFDLRRLTEEVGNLLAPAAFAKGLELLVDYPPSAPTAVCGDPVRIRQILLNLASNAVKFTSAGEVSIRVLVQPVTDESLRLRFEVADTGIGIDRRDQDKLFDSFSQADASTTRRYGGTGLGLAICLRLVEVMEGRIGLDSTVGVGSTFWFELELPASTALPTLDPERPTLALPAGLRVLVVDDNATNRTILDAQLSALGMKVDLVDNAGSALDLLRGGTRRGARYDLAVLDMLMPEVDGLTLARTITEDPELTGLPMIMLTSAQRLPDPVLREAGIGRWLTKPVRATNLRQSIERVLGQDTGSRAVPSSAASPEGAERQPGHRGRVLIVEDNELNQLVAAGLVERLGFASEVASNGAEALVALASRSYDVVLMDCHMPVMDGFAATEEIRRRERGRRRTPVVALTAGALVSDRERCLSAGMDDYVAKPIDAETLTLALDRWAPDQWSVTATTAFEAPGRVETPSRADQPSDAVAGPVVDAARLEGLGELRTPDGASLLASFVTSFTSRAPGRVAAIRDCARRADEPGLSMAAHELKGSAATIGAVRVAAISGDLERGGVGRLARQPELLDQLETELVAAVTELTRATASYA